MEDETEKLKGADQTAEKAGDSGPEQPARPGRAGQPLGDVLKDLRRAALLAGLRRLRRLP